MHRKHQAVTLFEAASESPTLSQLARLTRESTERLRVVLPLLPESLRGAVRPGPIDGETWCVLVSSAAASAKLRQLLPAMQACLRSRGWQVSAIRLKVQTPSQTTAG